MRFFLLFISSCLLFVLNSFSQDSSIAGLEQVNANPFLFDNTNRDFAYKHEMDLLGNNKYHSSVKPYADEQLKSGIGKNLIRVSGILNGEFGYEKEIIKGGSIGPQIRGIIKNKFSFSYTFLGGNSAFLNYQDSAINYSDVVPGMGSAYDSKSGYSYQHHFGYAAYSPNKIFNFQIGRGKNFWGDGYRSLFLSDIANSYPYFKITTNVWHFKYVNLFTEFKDVTASLFKSEFKNKYGSFHYLSWNASKRFNFSLFEAIIWQGTDKNRERGFDVNYLNPVIFYRPVEYSLGSSDNALLGGAFKIKVGRKYHQQFYGQVILDEFLLKEVKAGDGWWANKQGIQVGFKSFDLFRVKKLYFQTEINAVRPYTYAHGSVQQNYGHYNQPLAHPLGANFTESVSFLNYRYKKWMIEEEFLFAEYGKDKDGKNYGGNIFESYTTRPNDYGNTFYQGLRTKLVFNNLRLLYELVPSSNLSAEAGIINRKESNEKITLSTTYFYIGIRTTIMNNYRDF